MSRNVLVNLNMNGNEIQNVVMQVLAVAPSNPKIGQYYYNSASKKAFQWDGSAWKILGAVEITVDSALSGTSTNPVQNKVINAALSNKVDKVSGKGLSTNDYTTTEKNKLSGIAEGANKTVVDNALIDTSSNPVENQVVTAALGELSGKLNNKVDKVTGKGLSTNDFTDAEKQQLANLAAGTITVDSELSSTSINPVQNKVINSALGNKVDKSTVDTLSGKVSTLESQMVSMPADISAMGGSTSYKLTLEDADGSTLGAGATISQATSTNVGVVKLDSSVTASGANPVTGKAIHDYVGNAIAASDAMIFKGTLGTGGTITALPTTYKTGWTYRVITAGTYAGNVCEVGDLVIALVDRSGSGNVNADWTVAQTNINGAITSISGTSPVNVSGSGSSRTVSHANSGVTAGVYGSKSAQTPGFGDTANVPYTTVNATGHVTEAGTVAVKIPNTVATATAAGLMSAGDKKRLDTLSSTYWQGAVIEKGSTSVSIPWANFPVGYDSILSSHANEVGTGNEVVVDVVDSANSITFQIASAYTADIYCTVLVG